MVRVYLYHVLYLPSHVSWHLEHDAGDDDDDDHVCVCVCVCVTVPCSFIVHAMTSTEPNRLRRYSRLRQVPTICCTLGVQGLSRLVPLDPCSGLQAHATPAPALTP